MWLGLQAPGTVQGTAWQFYTMRDIDAFLDPNQPYVSIFTIEHRRPPGPRSVPGPHPRHAWDLPEVRHHHCPGDDATGPRVGSDGDRKGGLTPNLYER